MKNADKYGWDVAREYKDDPITENSEDSQRLKQAKFKAKQKRIDKNNNNPFRGDNQKNFQQRFTPYNANQLSEDRNNRDVQQNL